MAMLWLFSGFPGSTFFQKGMVNAGYFQGVYLNILLFSSLLFIQEYWGVVRAATLR